MTTNFDLLVFWHALYVAFAYSWLAFGATAYRQYIDKYRFKDVDLMQLGEDIYYTYDPLMMYWIASFVLLAILFFFIGYIWTEEARVERYAVPLGFTINTVQIAYRMKQQRLQIRTFGIFGRKIFEEDFRLIRYDQIHLIEVEKDPIWNIVTFYYTDPAAHDAREVHEYPRRVTGLILPKLLVTLEQKTTAKIFTKGEKILKNL